VLYTLFAIFFWFIGYSAVEAQFTTYGVEYLDLKEGVASLTLGFFSLSFILFAIPSGLLVKKLGRARTINLGIMGLIVMFLLLFLIQDLLWIRVIMLLGGLCWALINIHSYPMIVQHATAGKIGLYTGIYYLFSSVASSIGPFLLGGVMDLFGYPALFIGASVSLLAAFWFMRKARRLQS
jgi:MFS family permease